MIAAFGGSASPWAKRKRSTRSPAGRALVGAVAVIALLLSLAAPVQAAPNYFQPWLSQIGIDDAPCGLATDSEGSLYVAAYYERAIKIYSPSGNFITQFTAEADNSAPCGIAVDSAGNVYVNGYGVNVAKYNPSAFPPTATTTYQADSAINGNGILVASEATSVAADPATDNVYVTQGAHISSYQPDGTPISETIGAGVAGASYYGVDVYGDTGQVYATDVANDKAYIFNAAGNAVQVEIDGADSEAGAFTEMAYAYLAVDQSNGHVFVSDIKGHGVVDEFDAAGAFVSQIAHDFHDPEPADIAVDNGASSPNQGYVYVTSYDFTPSGGNVYAFGPLAFAGPPAVVTGSATALQQTAASLTGSVNPQAATLSDCHFEYVADVAFGESKYDTADSVPCADPDAAEVGAGTAPVEVHADLSGLAPGTTYHFRLTATNPSGTARGPDKFFTTLLPPAISDLTTAASSSTATLKAKINPNGSDTSYRFEYGTDSTYGTSVPVPDEGVGAGTIASSVSQRIAGLQPDTVYHYRVVATSAAGVSAGGDHLFSTGSTPVADSCPNAAIRAQQDSTMLPDCRAWEMVSLAEKNQSNVLSVSVPSLDGGRIAYDIGGGFPAATSGGKTPLVATRTSAGWISRSMLPSLSQIVAPTYALAAHSPDVSSGIFNSYAGTGSEPASIFLLRLDSEGNQTVLHTFPQAFTGGVPPVVASDDLSHVFVSVPIDELDIPFDGPDSPEQLYDFGSGTKTLVSRMPGTDQAPSCGIVERVGFASDIAGQTSQNWASSDGSRAFFVSAGDAPDCATSVRLFRRDLVGGVTTEISGPPLAGDPDQGAARFLQASPDASWVIYRTATSLVTADDAGGSSNDDLDIYRWDQQSGNACLTCAVSDAGLLGDEGSTVGGPLKAVVSADGSHVYFDALGAFAGAPEAGSSARPNTYVWNAGEISFVGRTSGLPGIVKSGTDLTPDGNVLVFVSSSASLNAPTGSDNGGYSQLYRYDHATRDLTCVSCPSSGAAQAAVEGNLGNDFTTRVGGSFNAVTDDGGTAFFTTAESLLSGDTDTSADIYQWRDGKLALITDGASDSEVVFATASPDGRDVFFKDTARLVPTASDGSLKLYDARAGGGFPHPLNPPAPCDGDNCRGTPSPQPVSPAAASATASGSGNLKARHHRKRHKHQKGKRHHKNKHAPGRANDHRRAGR